MKPVLDLFPDVELESICSAVRRVLAKKGLRFVIPEVLDVFRSSGFEIKDDVVYINSDQLDQALKTVPEKFTRRGGNSSSDVMIGDGPPKFAVGSVAIWIIETAPEVKRRAATLNDMKQMTALSEALDSFEIGNAVVQPREVPVEVMHVLWNRNNSVRMNKPACCWYGTSMETAKEGLEVLKLAAGGIDELRDLKRWAITICPDSALQWGHSSIGAMIMAEADVPVEVLPMPFLGSTHPVTLAGALVQSAAEVLGIVVLTQLVRPGCPINYSASYGGIMDMSTGSHSFGAPESALFAAASTAVGKAFGLTTNMMHGTTDSKLPDAQAAMERTFALMMPALAGADCITMAGSLLDFALSASYEQLVIDDEIVEYVKRIAKGSVIDKATLAEEEIMDLPFGGHFIESSHTLEHFRSELYFPKLVDRRQWEAWYEDGAQAMVTRARKKAEEIIADSEPVQGLPPDRQQAVDEFVAEICVKHEVDPEPLLY